MNIDKIIDDLYKDCIVHETMPLEYQEGMEIFLRRLKETLNHYKSLPSPDEVMKHAALTKGIGATGLIAE